MLENMRKNIVEKLTSQGLLITPNALNILLENYESEEIIQEVIRITEAEGSKLIEEKHVRVALSIVNGRKFKEESFVHEILAKQIEEDLKVIKSYNKPKKVSDSMQEKIKYFMSRYEKISKILKQRVDFMTTVSLEEVIKNESNGPFKCIVIILEKGKSKLVVEDPSEVAEIIVPKSNPQVYQKFLETCNDIVVGIEIIKKDSKLLLHDIVFPEIPEEPARKSNQDVAALLISDLHIGSKFFSKESFNKIIAALRGRRYLNEQLNLLMNKVKYIIIAGDIVDGVLIYPGQEKELEIVDILEQYEEAVKNLREIPEYITLVIIPGNHDAERKAIPQPPISNEVIMEFMKERGNVYNLSNPSFISLHNVRFLLFHGQSLEDIASSIPGISYYNPEQGMKYLLRTRHIAPIYGNNTQIALDGEDELVIEEKPDVFHAGHVHVKGYDTYRGTRIINSGTLQKITPYQESLGMTPTTGSFCIYLLSQGRAIMLNSSEI